MSAPAPAFDADSEGPVVSRKVFAEDNTGKDVPFEELQKNPGYLSCACWKLAVCPSMTGPDGSESGEALWLAFGLTLACFSTRGSCLV